MNSIMHEEWKPVNGYEQYYLVSCMGRIRSLRSGKLLSPIDNGNGYDYVSLWRDKKRKNHYVHRIVADAFCGTHAENDVVDHVNRNKKDNRASNLEWMPQRENIARAIPYMRQPHTKCKRSNTGEKYISKRLDGKYRFAFKVRGGKYYESVCKTLEEAVSAKGVFFGGNEHYAKYS